MNNKQNQDETKAPFGGLGAETLARIEVLKSRFPEGKQKSAILTILHEVQAANDNWLSVGAMDKVA